MYLLGTMFCFYSADTTEYYSVFTNFAEWFFANIFTTVCHGHVGVSPLNLESKYPLLIKKEKKHQKLSTVGSSFDLNISSQGVKENDSPKLVKAL